MPLICPPPATASARTSRGLSIAMSALLMVMLTACGGGGGSEPAATTGGTSGSNSQGVVATPAPVSGTGSNGSVVTAPPPVAASGYVPATTTLLSGAESAGLWRYGSEKVTSWPSGSVSVNSSGKVVLAYDFGCQSAKIVARRTDCRNAVNIRRTFPYPNYPAVPADTVMTLDLKNVSASANIAVMVWDSTNQVLRYPVTLRSIEGQSSSTVQRVEIALDKPSSHWGGANDGKFHDHILAMAISAQPFNSDTTSGGLNYPAGSVEVGDIKLHGSSTFNYALQREAALPVGKTFTASYKGRLAVASSSLNPEVLDKAVEAGIFTVRRDFNWEGTEINGVYKFNWILGMAQNAEIRGMKVLWILDYGHPDHGGVTPKTVADRQAYANFAKAVATAFKGKPVLGYEIWNEPDSSHYWPNPDVVAFGDLVARASTAIKAADPSAKVITGGLSNHDQAYLLALASQTSNLSAVDAIGIHPYRMDSFVTSVLPLKRTLDRPENYAGDQAVFGNILKAGGTSLQLWNTESGYSTVDYLDSAKYGDGLDSRALNRQAVLTIRKVLTELALDAPIISLYNLADSGTSANDREQNFGLLRADLTEKPVYAAIKTLYTNVGQLTFKGYLTDVPPHTHALRWDSATGRVFAMWADHPDFKTKVVLPTGVTSVKSWNGSTLAVSTNTDGKSYVTLSEEAGPVYVFVK